MNESDTILFFDGTCGLCNGLVNWLLIKDRQQKLKFATLQGVTAQKMLPSQLTQDLDTVVLWHQGKTFLRSEAILLCLTQLGSIWVLSRLLLILPGWLSDSVYRFIATRRYLWFGRSETCRLPTPAERLRFLD